MSFIRPSLRRWFSRWGEALAGGALALGGIWLFLRGLARLNWLAETLGIALILLGAAVGWTAWRKARFSGHRQGTGLVEITERQIRYLSPYGGGFVDIAAMTRLDVRQGLDDNPEWVIRQSDGPALHIPHDATGAERLYDAFILLEGMDEAALVRAANAGSGQRGVIWRAGGGFRALT